jgi:hypothetical protein
MLVRQNGSISQHRSEGGVCDRRVPVERRLNLGFW